MFKKKRDTFFSFTLELNSLLVLIHVSSKQSRVRRVIQLYKYSIEVTLLKQ